MARREWHNLIWIEIFKVDWDPVPLRSRIHYRQRVVASWHHGLDIPKAAKPSCLVGSVVLTLTIRMWTGIRTLTSVIINDLDKLWVTRMRRLKCKLENSTIWNPVWDSWEILSICMVLQIHQLRCRNLVRGTLPRTCNELYVHGTHEVVISGSSSEGEAHRLLFRK